jgi:transposase-like protein/IS1 family transposase
MLKQNGNNVLQVKGENMNCPTCNTPARKFGRDRNGLQRFRCPACKKTFLEPHQRPLGDMRLPLEKAISVIQHLVEGCSIRSTERITGVEKRTILSLLALVGQRCEKLMEEKIKSLKVKDVSCDEIWGYIGMKAKTKARKGISNPQIGDAWCYIALERHTKLILTWHLGQRNMSDTVEFTEKLARATKGSFQVNTDGFSPYKDAVVYSLGAQSVDFSQVIKIYRSSPESETRYSPSTCIGCEKLAVFGNPDLEKASTSHVERQNLTVRMGMRRMTRLTNGFSKKWLNLKWSYALHFAYYNFCRIHQTLKITPAMEAGIANHVWRIEEILQIAGT